MLQTKIHTPTFIRKVLNNDDWQSQQNTHHDIIAKIVDPYLEKKQQQHKDVVLDFLFDYYAFRPSHLKKWSPGFRVLLKGADQKTAPSFSEISIVNDGAFLNPDYFPEKRKRAARWILSLLQNSLKNKPSFGCFGMHEWAMVYKANKIRHDHLQLRISPKKLTEFVESRPLVCTHFDAFRFFTSEAQPLNKFEPTREKFLQTEQAGCLHTNMDLYKWAFKMYPWVSSNTIRRAFMLALETRTIDMKASPYDLQKQGLEPIKIETKEGRMEYVKHQKDIYQQSVPIRRQLIEEYRLLTNFL